MKKLILIFILIPNLLLSADKYQTNDPNVYIKNFQCPGSEAVFNLVNKSNSKIYKITLHIFDQDNDPINQVEKQLTYYNEGPIDPNSGKQISLSVRCNSLNKIGFSIN